MLFGRGRRRDIHRRRAARGDRLVTAKAPTTPEDQSEGVLDAVEEALEKAPARTPPRSRLRARDDRRAPTPCSRARAPRRRWSPPRASRTSRSSAARPGRTSTGSVPRTRRRSCRAELRVAVPERMGPTACSQALDEEATVDALMALEFESAAVLPALGLPPPRARARGALAERRAACTVDLPRDRRRLPRVRALRDHDGRRRPLPPLAALPAQADASVRGTTGSRSRR